MGQDQNVTVGWGILGTGFIADAFASGVEKSRTGRLEAVCSRTLESAGRFRSRHPDLSGCYDSYGEMLRDGGIDAVYIGTPHPFHMEGALQAIEAGKAVLCEKPMGMGVEQVERVVDAARSSGVFLMEGYMYRCSAQTARLIELLRAGVVGRVRGIEAVFSFREPFDPGARLFNRALGGGGIMDVGGYPVTLARLVAGVANGGRFAEPEEFRALGVLGASGVDDYTTAVALFPAGIIARMTCGVGVDEAWGVKVFGEDGRIELANPWKPGSRETIRVVRGGVEEVIEVSGDEDLYGSEADAVGEALKGGLAEAAWPAMGCEESLATARILEEWTAAVGVDYDF